MPSLSFCRSNRKRSFEKKIIVLGDARCGKTSLLSVFTTGYFPQLYEPAVFDNYIQEINSGEKVVQCSLWDMAGQDSLDHTLLQRYTDTDAIILCFSIDDPMSLENCEAHWAQEIETYSPNTKFLLAALKCDLREDETTVKMMASRQLAPIEYEQGLIVARRMGAAGYLECSAKHSRGVRECFEQAARLAVIAKSSSRRSCCTLM